MNRFLAASVLGLILLAIFATGVYFYQRYSIILLDPMRGVPSDAAIIVEIKKPAESLRDFFSGPFRKSLGDDKWMTEAEKRVMFFDSLLKEDGSVSEIWEDQSLVISTHLVKAGSFDFLYLTNLPRGWTEQKLKLFIEQALNQPGKFEKREYENVNIYEAHANDSTIFTFASNKSVAVFSCSPLLVEQAIRQLKDGSGITQTKAFLKVVPSSSKNSFVRIYFNNQSLKEIATSISPDFGNRFFSLASSFARWNGFSAESDEGFLSMKGSSVTFDTSSTLAFFRNQKPQPMNMSGIAPSRTALLFEFAMSNFPDYYNHLRSNGGLSLPPADRQKVLNDLQKKYNSSFETAFTSWIGSEMALIITEPAGNSIDNNVYACIRSRNAADALNQLNAVRDAVAKQSGLPPSQENYRDHLVSTINLKGIIPLFYGKIFSGLNGCSYTSLNDYIIFSSQPASLKSWIDENEEGKILTKDGLFHDAINRLGENGNVRLYLSPQRSLNLYQPSELHSFLSALYGSSGIHAQWNYNGASIGSQLLLDFHKKTMKEPALFWSTQLDTVLSSVPVAVEGKDEQAFVYVQDAKNSLYKLDASGNIVWKKNLEAKILSEIIPVDIYHDGGQQLLFNTASQLLLLDAEGNNTGNYPIRLPAPATNGCSVISTSYGYNIYVACSNHYIYAYEAGGKPVLDWNYVRTAQTVTKPVQAFSVRQNYYLVIDEDSGTVLVTDRKGNLKVSFADKFRQSVNGKSFLSKADSTGDITWITSDTTGRIISFKLSGSILKTETGDFTGSHEFIYMKANGAQEAGLVFFDKSMLYMLNEEGEMALSKSTPGFTSLLSAMKLPDGSNGLLISSATSDIFSILNSKGEAEKGFPLKGSIHPVMADLHRSVIICGNKSGMLYCYKTE